LARPLRPLRWVGSSKRDYGRFPARVQDNLGFALFLVQTGQHPPAAKPLKGLGSGVVELVEDFDGDTYRAVYTVRFSKVVYVLHAFMKKSKRGVKTPKALSRSAPWRGKFRSKPEVTTSLQILAFPTPRPICSRHKSSRKSTVSRGSAS